MKRNAGFGAALCVVVVSVPAFSLGGTGRRRDRALQSRHPADPRRELLRLSRARCSASRKADLRLDQREAAVKAGCTSTPGDLDASELIQRIQAEDRDEVMPPPSTKKTLTAEQKQTLKRWVESGGVSTALVLIAPTRPDPPAVKNEAWVRNPDRSLRPGQARGGGPRPRARGRSPHLGPALGLDLTGLPPPRLWLKRSCAIRPRTPTKNLSIS